MGARSARRLGRAQNEKRQLETAMVVESSAVNRARRGEGCRRSLEAGEGGDSEARPPPRCWEVIGGGGTPWCD